MPKRTRPGTRPGPRLGRMLVVVLAWASCFVLIRWGLRDSPVLWFAALRALIAGIALLGAATLSPRSPVPKSVPRDTTTWLLIGVLALLNVTVAFGAMAASTTGVTTGVASVLANTQALLVVLPAWWLFGERPRWVEIAGVTIGFIGLLVVALPSGTGSGAWLALSAAVGIASGALLARRLAAVDILVLGAWQFLLGGAVLAVIAAILEGPPAITWSARFVAALVVLAVAATALPYVLWFAELRRASLTAVTSWTLLVPVVGVLLGVVVLGEGVTVAEIIGDAIVIGALAVVAGSGHAARRRATASPARPPDDTVGTSSRHPSERP
ncbi:DMT family transporter [Amycolatopsis sp. NPDC003865]